MKKQYLLSIAVVGILLGLSSAPANAAKISMPNNSTSYIKKENTYNLRFKAPSKLTVTTKAKYTISNTSDWKCIPYKTSQKDTKVFYLRAGNYHLTTTDTKSKKIKTKYTKITSIRKHLETFSYKKYPSNISKPTSIKIGQTVKGMEDMYQTPKYNAGGYYQFTIDKDQKVTLDYSSMPVYQNARSNIFNDNSVRITPVSSYYYEQTGLKIKGKITHKKYSWNLTKGTYVMNLTPARGRYSFRLTTSNAENIPSVSGITDVKSTKDGLTVEYSKAEDATGYGVYYQESNKHNAFNVASLDAARVFNYQNPYPNVLSQIIPKVQLINGQTYTLAVGTIKKINAENNYGPISKPVEYTYYAVNDTKPITPKTPMLEVSYYDDHGQDEPYISVNWNLNSNVDSYEIAYRLKGTQNWTTFLTKSKTSDEISDPTNDTGSDFKKGQVYEVRVRALNSNLKSNWSKIKTVTVTVTPNR